MLRVLIVVALWACVGYYYGYHQGKKDQAGIDQALILQGVLQNDETPEDRECHAVSIITPILRKDGTFLFKQETKLQCFEW